MQSVYAVQFEIAPRTPEEAPGLPAAIRRDVADWIGASYGRRMRMTVAVPEHGEAIPSEGHLIRVANASATEDGSSHWQVDWAYPHEGDPRLSWHSHCEIAHVGGRTEFSFILRFASREFVVSPPRFVLRRPSLVKNIVGSRPCVLAGQPLRAVPQPVGATEIGGLVQRIWDPGRRLPLILVSTDPYTEQPVCDADLIADRLVGLADVHTLVDKWAGFALTSEIGKAFSCFNGAVRVYWPGATPDMSHYRHPLFLAPRIREMVERERPFADHLFAMLAPISTLRFSYGAITKAALESIERERAAQSAALRKQAEQSGNLDELLRLADEENAQLRTERDELRERNAGLERDLDTAYANLRAVGLDGEDDDGAAAATDGEPEIGSVRQAVDQAVAQFSDTLLFLKSAKDSADDSPFLQPERVFQALQAMDEVARQKRAALAAKQSMGRLEDAFAKFGFDYRVGESQTSKGKWASEYQTTYKGKKVSIESHLAIGKGQPDTCLRIHFLWDDATRQFVVAHVGRHKTNTKT